MDKKILQKTYHFLQYFLVPMVGVEPTRSFLQQILSLSRLPFHHIGLLLDYDNTVFLKNQLFVCDLLKNLFITFLAFLISFIETKKGEKILK